MVTEELDIWGKPVTGTHAFKWALDTLKAGGKVRRKIWAEGDYLRVNKHNILIKFYAGDLTACRALREMRYDLEWYEMSAKDWMAQ
jgi:hypothetical protein